MHSTTTVSITKTGGSTTLLPRPKVRATPKIYPSPSETLNQAQVRAQVYPTDDQLLDLAITFGTASSNHVSAGSLPQLRPKGRLVKKCGNSRCATCQHLQFQTFFTSTKTKQLYPIRHNFSCNSENPPFIGGSYIHWGPFSFSCRDLCSALPTGIKNKINACICALYYVGYSRFM